ncbi:MAG: EAL domain-containing protein [Candidatus Thiodiazotropha sp. (ex Epidulcina cf. delphinae)]|nr:EAL domain-containing protein [Candidatus Thiodiazotropha sp. (ex Epidulcina cf. delphinae)]
MKRYRFPLLMLLLLCLEGTILFFNYRREVDNHQQLQASMLQTAIANILDSYQRMTGLIYEESFNHPPVISLIERAKDADEPGKVRLRDELYRHLYFTYENLRKLDLRVLHFVLADGRSFLRFSRPDLFGDRVIDHRPMLQNVLAGRPRGGVFENGRTSPYYHYAFPLISNGGVVGAVDFGISFEAVRHSLSRVEPDADTEYQFIIKRDLMEPTGHPGTRMLFKETLIHSDYLIDKDADFQFHSEQRDGIDALLQKDPIIQQALNKGKGMVTEACLNGSGCFSVSLQPVSDSHQRTAGYIVKYMPMEEFRYLRGSHLTIFLLGGMLIIIAGHSFRHWLQSNQRLRTITDHMAEGMYVMDEAGKALYVNPTACQTLKYSEQELVGKDAHKLFHHHGGDPNLSSEHCPIQKRTFKGGIYRSDEEHFLCRDGKVIRVSIVSSPFWTERRLSGSVTLFRDITAEYEVKQRLLRSDVAFSSLAEGVMVVDAGGRIQAVNRAFSEITGYKEHEVLGRNPRFLKSGQHDDVFYLELWHQVTENGYWEGEIWNRRKNGQIYPEFLRIASVKRSSGEVTAYVATFSDVTEKRHHEQQLRKLAYNDMLTGLHNRAAFLEMFGHVLAHAQRRHSRCALLYLDLDRFKKINDTLGHEVGDRVLVETADRLREGIRSEDEAARLGGDEFIIMLEDIRDGDTPARVARKIISLLGQPIMLDPHVLHITASIGIAVFPEDGGDVTTLLKNADAAMYMAKREGRNGFHYFTPAMAEKEKDRFKLEIDLHTALFNDEFLLCYQPKIDLLSGEITGIETSLHWQHPQQGLLGAGEFISVAHDAGVMRDITHWVITESCTQLQMWLDAGLQPGRIAINIDAHTFNSSDAYDQIFRTVQITGISPHLVELEIPESGLLEKAFDDEFWRQMVELGFMLTIDDFGTGESSLYRLKHLPVSTLKIARSFVRDIECDEDSRGIIRAVIAMGKNLGLKVLAEGVENRRQLRFLHETDCNEVQGQLFSEPQPADAIAGLLASNPYKQLVETISEKEECRLGTGSEAGL